MRMLTVKGKPVSKGSMRVVLANRKGGKKYPRALHNNQEGIARYSADIAEAWERQVVNTWECQPKGIGIHLALIFQFKRPASHFLPINSKRTKPELRKDAPLFMVQDPDGDKLTRSVADALIGYAYDDDNQICRAEYRKRWGDEDLTHIEVGRIDGND